MTVSLSLTSGESCNLFLSEFPSFFLLFIYLLYTSDFLEGETGRTEESVRYIPGREEHMECSEEGGKEEEMTRRKRQRERGEVIGMEQGMQ